MSQKQIKKIRKEMELENQSIEEKKKNFVWTIRLLAIALIVVAGILIFYKNTVSDPEIDILAKCLTSKKVTMYGTDACSACQMQKKKFGKSFQYVNFVNCAEGTICEEKRIGSYPTWEINEEKIEGIQELKQLADKAGCEYK